MCAWDERNSNIKSVFLFAGAGLANGISEVSLKDQEQQIKDDEMLAFKIAVSV